MVDLSNFVNNSKNGLNSYLGDKEKIYLEVKHKEFR